MWGLSVMTAGKPHNKRLNLELLNIERASAAFGRTSREISSSSISHEQERQRPA